MAAIIKPCDYINFNAKNLSFADRVELQIGDGWEIKEENSRTYVVKKQPKYPKTYEECCKVLHYAYGQGITMRGVTEEEGELFRILIVLKRCRDAYWKIAGDWKPSWDKCTGEKYCIAGFLNNIKANTYADRNYFAKTESEYYNRILAFPTEEMRDAFYENFKELIEQCKELL